jgi:hypothetical protein
VLFVGFDIAGVANSILVSHNFSPYANNLNGAPVLDSYRKPA